MDSFKKYFPYSVATVALIAALYAWYHPKVEVRNQTEYVDRTRVVYKTVPVPVQGGTLQGTGETVQGNPVVAKADCPKSAAGSDVVSTVTTSTGEVHILVRPKKESLFSFLDDKEIGLRYGLGRSEIDLFGRWTFLRVGAVYGSLYAEGSVDTERSQGNIMLEVSYRF